MHVPVENIVDAPFILASETEFKSAASSDGRFSCSSLDMESALFQIPGQ